MAVLIEIRNSQGVVGRCDAKCYDAEHGECSCICGGVNHGVGFDQAVRNTREMAEDWIKKYARRHGLTDFRVELGDDICQLTLF